MQTWLYHKVPLQMMGDIIYPLNTLKDINPMLYRIGCEKYYGREAVMERRVPSLDCLWNDTVFLIATDPRAFDQAIHDAGLMSPRDFGYTYFKIDLATLDPTRLATFIQRENDELVFEPFDPTRMEEYANIPAIQYAYYQEKRKMARPYYLVHSLTTHVLYKGNIDIRKAEIITL